MSKKTGQKAKDRAKKVRKKILERREEIRQVFKKQKLEKLAERDARRIANRVDGTTIINRTPEEQQELIQRNCDILQALEEERKLLEQNRFQEQHERARGMKQSAEVKFIPNPETNEPLTATVDLVPKHDSQDTVNILNDNVVSSAATRLEEKLQSITKNRKMNVK